MTRHFANLVHPMMSRRVQQDTRYKDLLYVRRRFIIKEHIREAITRVVNATFRVRLPEIWGEATTACASDSKKFAALGPEPDDRVARALRWPRRNDLLARRA
jgi:TnpA family transposase